MSQAKLIADMLEIDSVERVQEIINAINEYDGEYDEDMLNCISKKTGTPVDVIEEIIENL